MNEYDTLRLRALRAERERDVAIRGALAEERTLAAWLANKAAFEEARRAEAAEARIDALVRERDALQKALREAIDDILHLSRQRWSEVEATEDELVGRYRAALTASAPPSPRNPEAE